MMKDFSRLDVLMNNAGVMMQETFLVGGVDNTFATNNFGPYLLTGANISQEFLFF
jgi:NAD(P)-dependent dehydrogenase (short-subunit alcohol dehydrogenase family)